MSTIAKALVFLVALIHFGIAGAEIFYWPHAEAIHKNLGFSEKGAQEATKIVKNAGLYNAFLAVGLMWGLARANDGYHIQLFFLGCVIVAGIFGTLTLNWGPLAIQTAPGILAMLAVLRSR